MKTFVAADGAPLSFKEWAGGAPPVVLVHGWQSTGATWDAMARFLSPRHRTLALDLRGCGASADAQGPYTVEQASDDVAEFLCQVVSRRAVVAGHSMGGAIALRLAVDHRELLAGIVLIAPVPPSGLALPPKADEIFRSTAGNRTNFARWLKRQSLAPLPEEQFSALVEAAATIRPEVAIESYESWTHLDFADAARGITTPTLVLPGEADSPNLTPERLTETVLSLVRNSQMTVIERCGHYVPLEQPEAAAAAIHRFARELPYDQLPG